MARLWRRAFFFFLFAVLDVVVGADQQQQQSSAAYMEEDDAWSLMSLDERLAAVRAADTRASAEALDLEQAMSARLASRNAAGTVRPHQSGGTIGERALALVKAAVVALATGRRLVVDDDQDFTEGFEPPAGAPWSSEAAGDTTVVGSVEAINRFQDDPLRPLTLRGGWNAGFHDAIREDAGSLGERYRALFGSVSEGAVAAKVLKWLLGRPRPSLLDRLEALESRLRRRCGGPRLKLSAAIVSSRGQQRFLLSDECLFVVVVSPHDDEEDDDDTASELQDYYDHSSGSVVVVLASSSRTSSSEKAILEAWVLVGAIFSRGGRVVYTPSKAALTALWRVGHDPSLSDHFQQRDRHDRHDHRPSLLTI